MYNKLIKLCYESQNIIGLQKQKLLPDFLHRVIKEKVIRDA